MATSSQYPKIDLYEQEIVEKTNVNTIKPIIAGLLLIIPGIFILIGMFDSNILDDDPFILVLKIIIISCIITSIAGGFCAIKRIKHRFALYGAILCLIGLNLIGIIAMILIVTSDDEFCS